VGEAVQIIGKLQELSQNEFANITGSTQSTFAVIENDRVQLGIGSAKVLAKAHHCHPPVLVFPDWGIEHESVMIPYINYSLMA